MKILIVCSKQFYEKIAKIKDILEDKGHQIFLPNCYNDPLMEAKMRNLGKKEHQVFKAKMFKQSDDTIKKMDAVLVLNFDKNKNGKVYKNYIGGATFLEMYDAFRHGKKIFLYNSIPEGMLFDEIEGFNPTIIDGDLNLIKQ